MKNPKIILVTGASSGIGKATAHRLLADGHTVYVAARRTDRMKDLQEAGATPFQMDITRDEDIAKVVDAIIAESGTIDVLVNNAGYAVYGAVEDIPIDTARRQFEVNLFGLARLTQMVLPHMRRRGKGTIINLSSMGGKIHTPLGAWYHASKFAVEGWSDCLRLELKDFGIDVVIIEPGIISTEFGNGVNEALGEYSASGAYAELAEKVIAATRQSYGKGGGTPPSAIADVISKAVSSKRPRTRYVKGKLAKPLIFIRKFFGDRLFDKAVMTQVK